MEKKIKSALISVFYKDGLEPLARQLVAQNVTIYSTGGTQKFLEDLGITCVAVESLTTYPSILGGRVKTLHPAIFGGILGRRYEPQDLVEMEQYHIPEIDLVIVDLYPFEETLASGASHEDIIEKIDIGGISLIRAAAKNFQDVVIIPSVKQYASFLDIIRQQNGASTLAQRQQFAGEAFHVSSHYDTMIHQYFVQNESAYLKISVEKNESLRYGENPHQSAAFYKDTQLVPGALANYRQLQGKELSYNNIADADAAWECVKSFGNTVTSGQPACVIIKHANPCGVAVANSALEAYQKAFKTDSTSAFGGIIAFNRPCDGATAEAVSKQFVEVLIAPAFSPEALAIFASKQNVRLLEIELAETINPQDIKRVGGGLLVQSPDAKNVLPSELRVVTKRQPTPKEMEDLMFAWRVAKYVKSNAIVFCGDGMTLGVGAGQMSRIDSARIASIKAQNAGLTLQNSAVASDAFFPFRDGLDVVVDAGATCVIQPGGSMRDDEVVAAADERGVAMVYTGTRHFRH